MKAMKNWKRNAVAATVVLFICAGVYLNWSYTEKAATITLTDTLDAAQVLGESTLVLNDAEQEPSQQVSETETYTTTDYFASVRLSRQETRDRAVSALQEAMAYEDLEEGK